MNTRRLCHQLSVLAVAAFVLCTMPGCSKAADQDAPYDIETLEPGERALVTLPLEFDVHPGNRLYLFGERVHSVHLEIGPGDSLRLNGVAILPLSKKGMFPEGRLTEATYLRLYGEVPLVRELMASGKTAAEAAEQYLAERKALRARVLGVYGTARAGGSSPTEAVQDAYAKIPELDELNLVDWERGCRVIGPDGIKIAWRGTKGGAGVALGDPPERSEPKAPTTKEKRLRATEVYELVGLERGPCWHVVSGVVVTLCGADTIGEAAAQLESSREAGEPIQGPLPETVVREILEAEEGGRR